MFDEYIGIPGKGKTYRAYKRGVEMDKQEFMDRKRVLFEEFLEVIETMDYPKQKDFIDNFFNHFFNSIYEEGVFEATQRVVALR